MNVVILATNQCVVSAVYGLVDVFYAANYCYEQRYTIVNIPLLPVK